MSPSSRLADQPSENSFSCSLSAILIARVHGIHGDTGVRRLLKDAGSPRTLAYLTDVGNWINFEEATLLMEVGQAITGDPNFARHLGEDAVKVLGASATATILRTLGSPEEHLRQLHVSSHRFSTAADLEAVEVRRGYAEVRAVAAPGFMRHRMHCDWTTGILGQATALFGLPPARVEHYACQSLGAPDCRYFLTWDPDSVTPEEDSAQIARLRNQLESMSERLQNLFSTAADLVSSGDLQEILVRITDSAAHQVRAPKYLLAVRPAPEAEVMLHHRGLTDADALAVADRALQPQGDLPENWCTATVKSDRREYGRLVAMYPPGSEFFQQERELLELYARYAATVLDSTTALQEAQSGRDEAERGHQETRALLELARDLASAGTSEQIAGRLAEAVRRVIECDRVSVYLWDEARGELVRRAVSSCVAEAEAAGLQTVRPQDVPQLSRWLTHRDTEPLYIDIEGSAIRDGLRDVGAVAAVTVPIVSAQHFLGCMTVSVSEAPERIAPSAKLRDRLIGVAAHAAVALENGHLVDHVTHQARHDELTGLANRLAFGEQLAIATTRAQKLGSPLTLFYVDLDNFKEANDKFGHEIGDELLREVARRLLARVRDDDAAARLGGDEFAILVDGIGDQSQLNAVSARLARAFDTPFVVESHTIELRASIGRAVWPSEIAELDGLLREADAAMYEVKRSRPRRTVDNA